MKLRVYLVGLIFAIMVPMLVFSAVTAFLFHRQTVSATERGLIETARALSVAIEREVTGTLSALNTLSASDYLRNDNLKGFDQRARSALATNPAWENIVLYDAAGQQLVNLRVPFGTPLPIPGDRTHRRRVPPGSGRPTSSSRPSDGKTWYNFRPDLGTARQVRTRGNLRSALTDLLLRQQLPPESIGSLLDRNKIFIARTRGAAQYVGQPAPPDLARKTGEMAENASRSTTRDGVPVYGAFSRSSLTGWTVALGVPVSAVDAPLRRSVFLLAGLGTLVTLVGVGVAGAVARRIGRPILALSEAAQGVVSGGAVTIPRSGVTEVD
jgi:hypothetical protein